MYHHLNQEERNQIYSESKAGVPVFESSQVSWSSSKHDLPAFFRNRGGCGYRPKQAHERAEKRRSAASSAPRILESVFVRVEDCLSREWRPEQKSGRSKQGGELHKRLQYPKKYRKMQCGRKRYGGPK